MELRLSDAEVKEAICEWLRTRMTVLPPESEIKIRRLYFSEGSDFAAVVAMPDEVI